MDKESFQMERKQSTFRKELNRNMRRIDMKATNNDENLDMKNNVETVEGERKIQNRVKKEVKKRRAKKNGKQTWKRKK